MIQKILLGVVISAFFFVWGTVIYQIFIKEDPKFAKDMTIITLVSSREIEIDERSFHDRGKNPTTNEAVTKNVIRTKTEENRLRGAPLSNGLDYGDGVSVDDLLNELGGLLN